jgi:hypothetical protein
MTLKFIWGTRPGKHRKNYGKYWKDPPLFMGKLTISMVIFHSYVANYQRLQTQVYPLSFREFQ